MKPVLIDVVCHEFFFSVPNVSMGFRQRRRGGGNTLMDIPACSNHFQQGRAVTCRWKWWRPLTSRFCSPHSKVTIWHTQSHQKVAINQWQLLCDLNRISRLLEVKLGRKVPPRPIVAGEPLLTVRCLSAELLGKLLYSKLFSLQEHF